jgi:hypothetical protein
MVSEKASRETVKRRLDASIARARATLAACPDSSFPLAAFDALAAFDTLVAVVQSRATLLGPRSSRGGPDVVAGLRALTTHGPRWIRPAETWAGGSGSPWVQFASLAEHLLAQFPMPRFMASVWFEPEGDASSGLRDGYVRLGRGESVRHLGWPIRLTRAMAHRFVAAPHHLTAIGALRWAQAVGKGGSPSLGAALAGTRLGRELANEDFWETVVDFLVRHPEIDSSEVGPIVDFVQHQRFAVREGITASGEFGLVPPPQPHFLLKGRTPASIRRLVAEWHRALGTRRGPIRTWARSGIREASWVERVTRRTGDAAGVEARAWSIREICSSAELEAEGRAMRHCVATYADRCLRRQSSIWSLQLETPRGHRRVLTVEVDLARRVVCQARRKANARPSENERALVMGWAEEQGLDVAPAFVC